jgi:hypothetical protein
MQGKDLNIKNKVYINTKSYTNNWNKLALLDFSYYINSCKCLRLKIAKKLKFYNLLCEKIFQAFLHVFFTIFFAFLTPGKQPYYEISEMTTHRNTHSEPTPAIIDEL